MGVRLMLQRQAHAIDQPDVDGWAGDASDGDEEQRAQIRRRQTRAS